MAGCLAGSPAADEPASACVAVAPGFDSATGAIAGFVFDDEGIPVHCAEVGSVVLGSFRTGDDGSFGIPNAPPGDHIVYASALGFSPQNQVVTVEGGQITNISFSLGVDETLRLDPYHESYREDFQFGTGAAWKLTPECIYDPLTEIHPQLKTCGSRVNCVVPESTDCAEYGIGNPGGPRGVGQAEGMLGIRWSTLLLEGVFEPAPTSLSNRLLLDVLFPNVTRDVDPAGATDSDDPHIFHNYYDDFEPLRVERQELADRGLPPDDHYGDVIGRVFPAWDALGTYESGPDVGFVSGDEFSVWVTIAYNDQPLPPDFSAVA